MESEQLYHRGYSRNSYNSIASASSDEELLDGAGVIMDFHTTEDDNLLDGDAASPGRERGKPNTSPLAVLSFWALPPSWARPLMNPSLRCPVASLEFSLGFSLRCILKKFKYLLVQRCSSSGCESPSYKCQGASCVSACVLCFPLIQFLCHVPPFYFPKSIHQLLCVPSHQTLHTVAPILTQATSQMRWDVDLFFNAVKRNISTHKVMFLEHAANKMTSAQKST